MRNLIVCAPIVSFINLKHSRMADRKSNTPPLLAIAARIQDSAYQSKIPPIIGIAMIKTLSSLFFVLSLLSPGTVSAQDLTQKVLGETIYVPAYSRIFSYPNRSDLLAATLAVHNVDPDTTVTLTKIDYHGEDGALLRNLLETPLDLAPLQSRTMLIPINDTSGGVGANFIVVWSAGVPALSPIAEAIMTSGSGGPGPSFTSRGRVIERQPAD